MKKTIALLSFLFPLFGIFGMFFFLFFDFKNLSPSAYVLVFGAKPYFFQGLDISYIVERQSENSYTSIKVSLLNLFFCITFLAGAIVYVVSKFRETRLLIFNYSLIIISSCIGIIFFLGTSNNLGEPGNDNYFITFMLLSFWIFYFFLSMFFIIKHLQSNELNTYTETINEKEKVYLENASNSKRFLNLIIDSAFIILIAYYFLQQAMRQDLFTGFLNGIESVFGERFGALVYFSMFKFIYYFAFESIFKTTPAKMLTYCKVTDEEGNNPTIRNIFIRTLCRFIPLESISFLMGKNLHDSYSYTYVINQKKHFKRNAYYFWPLALGFLTVLIIYLYDAF